MGMSAGHSILHYTIPSFVGSVISVQVQLLRSLSTEIIGDLDKFQCPCQNTRAKSWTVLGCLCCLVLTTPYLLDA